MFVRANSTTSTVLGSAPDVTVNYQWNSSTVTVTYDDINNGNCKAFESSVFNGVTRPRAVVCNGSLLNGTGFANQYTIVHELGHIFDYRSDNTPGVQGGISEAIGKDLAYALFDCSDSSLLMGETSVGTPIPWTRGERGWGSGPARDQGSGGLLITNFQQNPLFYTAGTGKNNEEIGEAAADMFLNWVYRVNYDLTFPPINTCNSDPTLPYNHWTGQGFLNRDWRNQTSPYGTPTPGNPDGSLPGDVRHLEMHTIMRVLFNRYLNLGW